MSVKIVRGIQPGAAKVVLYGVEGIGKSTLAAQMPNPVILDTEDGSRRIDCAKAKCGSWAELMDALVQLGGDSQGFRTVVIDSVDWAEALLKQHLSKRLGKPVDDLPYGRGAGVVAEGFEALFQCADSLVANGINVVMIGHSTVKRCTPPDMEEGYDRYELSLGKQVAARVKEWADLVLFVNYRTKVVEGADGKKRGRGGKERAMYAERCAAWDAKNRFGLPAEVPMSIEALAPAFGPVPAAKPAGKPKPADEPLVVTIARHIAEAASVRTLGRIGDRIDVLASEGQLTDVEVAGLLGAINARHQEIEPAAEAAT